MNKRPPSLRNVAELAEVSPATASMALRGLARVPDSTRKVVERAAAELGYIRDPEIGNVLARSRRKATIPRETIVFLSEIPIGAKPDPRAPWLFDMQREAAAAAHLLGCELETIVTPSEPAATRELGKKLWMRGIRGILVAPVTLAEEARIDLDWGKFSAVEIGTTLRNPRLHRVERLFFEDCSELFELLRARGRHRIGLALDARRRYFMRNIPEAALLLHLRGDTNSQYVEPLPQENWNREGFLEWIKKEKPDCIVVYEEEPIRWLKSAPKNLRAKIGTAYLSASKPDQTGLVADVSTMVRECIGMIHWMIQTGERGIPVRCRSHGFRNLLQKGKSG